jgi:hypothetical protein
MSTCKECSIEYDTGVKEFCTIECFKINLQKRINEATAKEESHTKEFS